MKKRGLSPVIATVLLIAMVMVLAFVVFLWARGFVKEAVMKDGRQADQVCEDIKLQITYTNGDLQLVNIGNIPVYAFKIKEKYSGRVDSEDYNENLPLGESKIINIGTGYEEVEVFPIILGETKDAKHEYQCKNSFSIS